MLSDLDGVPRGHQAVAASHTDIGPTVLSASGICADNSFVGHSLLKPAPHRMLVNKNSNYLYRDGDYTMIGVDGFREQLYRTDDFLEENDYYQDQPDVLKTLKREALSYRRLLDYAYENSKFPSLDQ